jgi:dinuclear metal center YbgI/SA1388 family protein
MTHLASWAPSSLAANWDRVGLQIGDPTASISRIHLSLDVDLAVLNHIQHHPTDLVITHHPIFFKPLTALHTHTGRGKLIHTFLTTSTHLLSLHTNLDAAVGGVNDIFMSLFGFSRNNGHPIEGDFGCYFELNCPYRIDTLRAVQPCRVVGYPHTHVSKIGFLAGSGHGLMPAVKSLGLDCFITGELSYHDEIDCALNHITGILVGHHESEVPILPHIKTRLLDLDPKLEISVASNAQAIKTES